MRRVCAWCGLELAPTPEPPPPDSPGNVSHGMCAECRERISREAKADAGNEAGSKTPGPAGDDTAAEQQCRPGEPFEGPARRGGTRPLFDGWASPLLSSPGAEQQRTKDRPDKRGSPDRRVAPTGEGEPFYSVKPRGAGQDAGRRSLTISERLALLAPGLVEE